eukprot:CAMPEP_0202708458 /NCGR_PEP_ID=MMETSP1385-20130828/20664_1 /ASSEMBLY_ACC=CAM_ASM_000861 /TAXON_ID=933848 /ORGANISM="Elphidium margaritaceum" /LENGTH=205 /DNA_ID=CAMNT_0049367433 /DNA_START=19 /DNA_END=636 /DNA_ORIENTATION=+
MASETKQSGVFPQTQQFVKAIEIINGVDAKKLSKILSRIIDNLDKRNEKAFSEEEEEKLCEILTLDGAAFATLISCSSFIFDQSAKNALKANKLTTELNKTSMDEAQINGFVKAWTEHGPKLIEKLKETCFAPTTLKGMNWSLQMSVASQNSARLRQPRAIFELNTGHPISKDKDDSFFMELSMDELTNLFNDLEQIQKQLDSLT